MMKKCFKCGIIKELESEFYKHARMAGGYLNKCIECTKKDSRDREILCGKQRYLEYKEGKGQTPKEKERLLEAQRRGRTKNPEKAKARNAVSNALRDGKIIRYPCNCGNIKSQAHHKDYSKLLEIDWLCRKCHLAEHDKTSYDLDVPILKRRKPF
jgi:hypothetical protein